MKARAQPTLNREGLTFKEWLYAAATTMDVGSSGAYFAWLRGEDPSDYRAEAQTPTPLNPDTPDDDFPGSVVEEWYDNAPGPWESPEDPKHERPVGLGIAAEEAYDTAGGDS